MSSIKTKNRFTTRLNVNVEWTENDIINCIVQRKSTIRTYRIKPHITFIDPVNVVVNGLHVSFVLVSFIGFVLYVLAVKTIQFHLQLKIITSQKYVWFTVLKTTSYYFILPRRVVCCTKVSSCIIFNWNMRNIHIHTF